MASAFKVGVSSRLTVADFAGMTALMGVLLLLSWMRTRHTIFWSDEVMGLLVLRAPTLGVAMHLWRDGIDSSGIFFELFGRVWVAVFGSGVVAVRLFSAVGVAASAAMLWVALRRYYKTAVVGAALAFVYAAVGTLRWQLANGRSYGLLLFACSLVLVLLLRGEEPDKRRGASGFLAATLAAYALLTGSHILGVVWGALFLVMQTALDLQARRKRPGVYVAALAGMVAVVAYSLPNFRATAALGKPSFWTQPPGLHDLLTTGVLFNGATYAVTGLLSIIALLRFREAPERRPVLTLVAGFVLADAAFFVLSHLTTPVYVNRYLVPLSFGLVIVLCEAMTQTAAVRDWASETLPAVVAVVAAALFFVPKLQRHWLPFGDYSAALLAPVPASVPIVVHDTGTFTELEYMGIPSSARLLYPVDWETVLLPGRTGDVSGTHEMDNFKRDGLYRDAIVTTADVLTYDRFTVVAPPGDAWFTERVIADKRFSAEHIANYAINGQIPLQVWTVTRRSH